MSIRTMDDLEGHPIAGHSWEGFIVEQIAASRPGQQESCFFRTNAGAEIDLVLLKPGKESYPLAGPITALSVRDLDKITA